MGGVAHFVQQFKENEIQPILDGLKKNGIDIKTFERFLHARHAQERNAAMAKLHPTAKELAQRIADLEARIQSASGMSARELNALITERDALKNAPVWTGTEEERNRLSGMSNPKLFHMQSYAAMVDQIIARTRAAHRTRH
jgi:DNA-binding transcriptional MerR regulator